MNFAMTLASLAWALANPPIGLFWNVMGRLFFSAVSISHRPAFVRTRCNCVGTFRQSEDH
jgi:hypothetical protein